MEFALIENRIFCKATKKGVGRAAFRLSSGRVLIDYGSDFPPEGLSDISEGLTELTVWDWGFNLDLGGTVFPKLRIIDIGPGSGRTSIDFQCTPALKTLATSRKAKLTNSRASRVEYIQAAPEPVFMGDESWPQLERLKRLKIARSFPENLPSSIQELDVYDASLPERIPDLPNLRCLYLEKVKNFDAGRLASAIPSLEDIWVTDIGDADLKDLKKFYGTRVQSIG